MGSKRQRSDWWKNHEVRVLLLRCMHQSLGFLILHAEHLPTHESQATVYSGFFLEHRGRYFWMTAGHVIHEIRQIMSDPRIRIRETLMRDGVPPPDANASTVPMPLNRDEMFGFDVTGPPGDDASGLDFGMIALRPLMVASLTSNPGTRFLPGTDTLDLVSRSTGGMYVIGAPIEREGKTSETNLCMEVHCLPIRQLAKCPSELSNCARAIYGQLVEPAEGGPRIGNISGMSGGPVFAVERRPGKTFGFRLVGIQSAWHETSRTVRISPVADILVSIDEALRKRGH